MAGKRGKNADLKRIADREGDAMLSAVPNSDWVIALDVMGKRLSTEAMASRIEDLLGQGRNLSLLIGGPEGLAERCLIRANERWSLSDLTLPHPLVRIVIAEQLYRSWTIIHGHPYHR
jgi:23S rRNA (pseudouridine1915-N3)-methyltransferase